MMVCSGVSRIKRFDGGFFLAGDKVDLGVGGSLILCVAGDLEVREILSHSVVITRGSVYCHANTSIYHCLILAGGDIHLSDRISSVRDCSFHAIGKVHRDPKASILRSMFKELDPTALDVVRFFDPAARGVEVGPARFGVRVRRVAADLPFAKAGLRPDDLVTELDGRTTRTPDDFRRHLRRSVAEGVTALRVLRDGKMVELKVKCVE